MRDYELEIEIKKRPVKEESAMKIDDKLIAYLEDLSCLSLTEHEKKQLTVDLGDILGSMTRLDELDTENVPERSHPFDYVNAFRDDEIQPSFDRTLILKNAPRKSDEMFIAPKTVE